MNVFLEGVGFIACVMAGLGAVLGIIYLIGRFCEIANKVDELHRARREKVEKK